MRAFRVDLRVDRSRETVIERARYHVGGSDVLEIAKQSGRSPCHSTRVVHVRVHRSQPPCSVSASTSATFARAASDPFRINERRGAYRRLHGFCGGRLFGVLGHGHEPAIRVVSGSIWGSTFLRITAAPALQARLVRRRFLDENRRRWRDRSARVVEVRLDLQ